MTEIIKIRSLLESIAYEESRCACLSNGKGKNPFITISRESGAGGHTIATAILEEMKKYEQPLFKGWHVCDQEICQMLAEEPGLHVSIKNFLNSEYHSQIQDTFMELLAGLTPQDKVIKKMFALIRTLAAFGKVIFVGRGSAFVTRDLPLGLHFRCVAPLPVRISRMQKFLGLGEKEAKEIVFEQDRGRQKLVKTFFNHDIANPLVYDAVWNTERLPVDDIAKAAVTLVAEKACHCGSSIPLLQRSTHDGH